MAAPHPTARLRAFDDAAGLAAAVVSAARDALATALARRGQASLVVSGGATPRLYLSALSETGLDWPSVTVTLADERWVDESDARSNARLVRERLLRGPAEAARFVPLKNGAATPHAGAAAADAALATIGDAYDLVLLGMGEDAHIASLFPGAPELAAALDTERRSRCIGITPPCAVQPNVPRLSLTLPELLKGRRIVLVIAGAAKRRVLEHALTETNGRSPVAALIARARDPIDVLWLNDG